VFIDLKRFFGFETQDLAEITIESRNFGQHGPHPFRIAHRWELCLITLQILIAIQIGQISERTKNRQFFIAEEIRHEVCQQKAGIIHSEQSLRPGGQMRLSKTCVAWVVYRMTLPKQALGGNVVCEQSEWEALEIARPGYHVLLHTGIKSEQEAEKLARGTAGDSFRQRTGKKAEKPSTPSIALPSIPVPATPV
jgi:hypothetical protein